MSIGGFPVYQKGEFNDVRKGFPQCQKEDVNNRGIFTSSLGEFHNIRKRMSAMSVG